MFSPLPGHTVLPLAFEQVIAVIESINSPNIAIPELGTEPTKAWLVGALTPGGGASIFCYLLQLETNRPILYISNPAEVVLDQYSWLEAESIQYVESMGFMLDNLGFRGRDAGEQRALFESLPPFREQHARIPGSTPMTSAAMLLGGDEAAPEVVALARLLASF